MVKGLSNLISKEIKELLRDPKILLGMVLMPLITFPLMGAAMNISTSTLEESTRNVSVMIMNLDKGPLAESLLLILQSMNATIIETGSSTVEDALVDLSQNNTTTLVVIPQGFSQNLTLGLRAKIIVYSVFESLSLAEGIRSSAVEVPINLYKNALVTQAIRQAFPDRDPLAVLDPISISNVAVVKGKIVNVSSDILRSLFMSQSLGFPLVIMLLLISAMQIAATSISIEKEEKTLETLLTVPISRLGILTGKLAGSVVVAAAGAIASMVGVNYYINSFNEMIPTQNISLEDLGLSMTPLSYGLLGVMIFVTIVSALALAIIVAAFSENVRSAQALVGPLNFIFIFPSLILMFADIQMLPYPIQIVLYAIPYTHSIIATKAAFLGDYFTMLVSIAYVSAFTIAVLYIAARIFTTEKIVTARISFKKLKIRKP
ncbi:ABC transporter permease [Candidatus Bathyarchaeota archaeon]|nr:ABC transporter permease [Candidatus Bathyarchaeota archaeon]